MLILKCKLIGEKKNGKNQFLFNLHRTGAENKLNKKNMCGMDQKNGEKTF